MTFSRFRAISSCRPIRPTRCSARLPCSALWRTFLDARPLHDSLFSVTALQTRLWTSGGRALNHDPRVLLRTQDLEPVYEENSCLYLFEADTLLRTGNRIGERPLLFPIDPHEALDIDDEYDWEIVAALVARNPVTR